MKIVSNNKKAYHDYFILDTNEKVYIEVTLKGENHTSKVANGTK